MYVMYTCITMNEHKQSTIYYSRWDTEKPEACKWLVPVSYWYASKGGAWLPVSGKPRLDCTQRKGFLKMLWQTQQLQSVVAIHLWRGDYPRIKLLLCKNDMSRLYILNSSLFLGKKTKVGLEKKILFIIFSHLHIKQVLQ